VEGCYCWCHRELVAIELKGGFEGRAKEKGVSAGEEEKKGKGAICLLKIWGRGSWDRCEVRGWMR
jgi:hypothetical protein